MVWRSMSQEALIILLPDDESEGKELGCTGTHFANANGLWMSNHYTTAHDMALISQEAYKNPTFAKITGTKRYIINKNEKTCKT